MEAAQSFDIYAIALPDPARLDDAAGACASIPVAGALAAKLGGRAAVIVAESLLETASPLARAAGCADIWVISGDVRAAPLQMHQWTDVLLLHLEQQAVPWARRTLFLTTSDAYIAETAAQLAFRLQGAPLGRCLDLSIDTDGALLAKKSGFGGRLCMTIGAASGPYFAAVRTRSNGDAGFDTAALHLATGDMPSAGAAMAAEHRLPYTAPRLAAFDTCYLPNSQDLPPVEGARRVVSGGRGMGGERGFDLLKELALCWNAALGGSLPVVDAGWLPVARQVGQSGKYVSPDVYLAVGISGTPQHLAGVDPRTRIAAVNRDSDADIFRVAEIGVVADWEEFLPELIEALKQ